MSLVVQKRENHLFGQRAGATLRLSGDFGPQLINESVLGMALCMKRTGMREEYQLVIQMTRDTTKWLIFEQANKHIYHDTAHPSHLILPVIERGELPPISSL
jgi:hypothetical protein